MRSWEDLVKMDKEETKVINLLKKGFHFFLEILIAFVKLFLFGIVLIGSISSFLLLKNLYPETAGVILNISLPIFVFLALLVKISLWALAYLFLMGVFFLIIYKAVKKITQSNIIRREIFFEELADKLIKKQKRKNGKPKRKS